MDRPGPVNYDAELRLHHEVVRRACDVQPREHVLDIGCGSGQTTREAARMARAGSALGIDISASAIEQARDLQALADRQTLASRMASGSTCAFLAVI